MKLNINPITSGYRSVEALNDAFQDVEDAFENTLSRDGTGPNYMDAALDMNNHRIMNLHKPVELNDAARLKDVQDAFNAVVTYPVGGTSYSVVDIRNYITPSMSVSDISADPSTFFDVSELVRKAQLDAGLLGVEVDYRQLRGAYYMDPVTPIKVYKGSGMAFPGGARLQLSYTTSGGVKDSLGSFSGLCFLVNPLSARRTLKPVIAIEGGTTLTGPVQIAGVGLQAALAGLNTTLYPTITGTIPQIHAPIVACDCTNVKPGNIQADLHIVGVMQGFYLGDPLVAEEPWAVGLASGNQGAASFGRIILTGAPCYRLMGFARGTSGGLKLYIQAIPPYWTGISQPNSGGVSDYAALKYFQQFGVVLDMWHRAVGFDIEIQARGFRTGVRCQAGAGEGPNGQDTGKYNAGTFKFGVERIPTLLDVDQYSYLHRVNIFYGGHMMDEYNLKGENAPMIWIKSDALKAGAVDKSSSVAWLPSHDYQAGDKVSNGGNVYTCTVSGTSAGSIGPTGTNQTTQVVDGTCYWIYRNGGFKPFGYPPFARVNIVGVANEISGGLFENTQYDGHLIYNMDQCDAALWKQANGHHSEPLIWNKATSPVIRHMNSSIFASPNSQYVYNVLDHDRLHLGGNDYFGYTIPGDGSNPPQICNDPLVDFPNCNAYAFAAAYGDDDGGDE